MHPYSDQLNPGLNVVRAARARLLAAAGLSGESAVEYCERKFGVGSRPAMICRSAVSPMATTDPSAISEAATMASEFVLAIRAREVLSRLQGTRRVPMNVRFPRATAGATVSWVGERSVTPISSLALDMIELGPTKIAGIIPISSELLKLSEPAAEGLLRTDLMAAVTALSDRSFLDPSQAGEAGVSPASITYGAANITASGTNAAAARADIRRLVRLVVDAGIDLVSPTLIMTPATAIDLAALDGEFFAQVGAQGGQIAGINVITTNSAPADGNSPSNSVIVFCDAAEINIADPAAIEFDMGRHASIEMQTAPSSPPTTSTVQLSLWQHNLVALKATRYINWTLRRAEAVAYLRATQYVG